MKRVVHLRDSDRSVHMHVNGMMIHTNIVVCVCMCISYGGYAHVCDMQCVNIRWLYMHVNITIAGAQSMMSMCDIKCKWAYGKRKNLWLHNASNVFLVCKQDYWSPQNFMFTTNWSCLQMPTTTNASIDLDGPFSSFYNNLLIYG